MEFYKKKTINLIQLNEMKSKPCWRLLFVKSIVGIIERSFNEKLFVNFAEFLFEVFVWNWSINEIISSITLISSSRTWISACLDNRRWFNFSRIVFRYVSFPRWVKND